ncbi:hypothetical protein [Natronomonas sp. LN261]|uniref:DUF7283 family protein n=1 Tax=Natronomonas sp. LN261 TaxID=2750669 RepID=UPI0015EE4676|nr:hypothetical protein [Natronomonas sp. LN261]
MFEMPLDAWYVWIGLTIVSGTAVGMVSALPSAVPPDASGAARTVDSVAASEHAAVGKHPLSNAETARVGADSISLRGPGGTEHARFGYGPVVPVVRDNALRAALLGEPPERAFRTPDEFERAVQRARETEPQWQGTDRLLARRVRWEGTDVVLVG